MSSIIYNEKLDFLNKTKKIFIDICNNNINNSDINFMDIVGGTPLAWSALLGMNESVNDLIKRGANPNVKVFPLIYQVMKLDCILESALTVITQFLPENLKKIVIKENILKIFKMFKEHGYINNDGIQIKYIINILNETSKYTCYTKSMLERWKTQEHFDRKIRLLFWLFPKIADSNNYYIHKFFKDPLVSTILRLKLINNYSNNPQNSYNKIAKLIPLNTTQLDQFINEAWVKIIIPEMVNNMMVRIICAGNIY
jgi:ankyrin repeat protein